MTPSRYWSVPASFREMPIMDVPQITVAELAIRLASGTGTVLLDVRPADEWLRVSIPGSLHIPAAELPRRIHELDPDAPTAVICHFGIRSIAAAAFLLEQDFDDVCSVTGGIDLYARDVATELPRY